jgi:hypothetical protein
MKNRLQAGKLPESIEKLLHNQECLSYIVFASGNCFQVYGIYSPDKKRLLYGLRREYSRLGRSLVDAIWFHHPAKLLLICGQELFWSEVDVYKCHIAGPLFTDNLLRIRKKNPGDDIASSWEFRAGEWKKVDRKYFRKETANALSETEGSFLEEVHLDRKLRDAAHPLFR